MSEETAGNNVSRLLLGQRLRQLRERSGIHAEDAAAEVGVARATLWRMEKGDSRCRYKPGDVEMLGRLYGSDRETIDVLTGLAKATRTRSWVNAYHDVIPESLEMYIDLEGYASRAHCYLSLLVPDLLQTEDYAKATIAWPHQLTNAEVRRRTQVRLKRQAVLGRRQATAAEFQFILDEAVLTRAIGDPGIMVEQLRKINEVGRLPNVTIRVVPFGAGMYAGLEIGPFGLLVFPKSPHFGSLPTTAYLERLGEQVFLDKPKDVESYQERWDDVAAHALDEAASRDLIEQAAQRFIQH
jgi:transcriptional regulator with XRE-family HTH domain